MRQVLADRLERVGPALAHAGDVARAAWARPRVRITAMCAVLVFLVVLAVWIRQEDRLPPPMVATGTTDEWQYLVICGACGHRERYMTFPAATRESPGNGRVVCRDCGEARGAWYRRGGQVVPPGGW